MTKLNKTKWKEELEIVIKEYMDDCASRDEIEYLIPDNYTVGVVLDIIRNFEYTVDEIENMEDSEKIPILTFISVINSVFDFLNEENIYEKIYLKY